MQHHRRRSSGPATAGLAMSRRLTERSIDHVVLERGEVANSWRTERWDSLRLLTPNWQARLPGAAVRRERPRRLHDDARGGGAHRAATPPRSTPRCVDRTTVTRLARTRRRLRGRHRPRCVDTARPSCSPAAACERRRRAGDRRGHCRRRSPSVTPLTYRSPDQLDDGGVLVVGGVGHRRATRRRDPPQRAARHARRRRARAHAAHLPRPRHLLVDGGRRCPRRALRRGRRSRPRPPRAFAATDRHSASGASIDLNALAAPASESSAGSARIRDGVALFSGGLANTCRLADLKLNRLLDRFDECGRRPRTRRRGRAARAVRTDAALADRHARARPAPANGIRTVVWATGFRPDHSWLDLPVFDHKGRVRHRRRGRRRRARASTSSG